MAEDWRDRFRAIADALLTLEVNTIEKVNMSAQKMPEVPLALHAIIGSYADYLKACGYVLTNELYKQAQDFLASPVGGKLEPDLQFLGELTAPSNAREMESLTNGPATFEALQWAAFAAKELGARADAAAFTHEQCGVLSRIRANSRQLREAARKILDGSKDPAEAKLFNATVDQTITALMASPRPVLRIDADITLLVRKAWDIGTETVLFQTVLQVDGDVVMRVSPELAEAKRAFFADLHRAAVEAGTQQWRLLFDLAKTLVGAVGHELFGM